MNYRRADINDAPHLAELRKRQLLDEGSSPVADISRELEEYFHSSLADGSFISWLATDNSVIVATSGVCFYQLPPTYSNPTGQIAYVTNMFTLPEYRRQGIASHLLELVVGEAKRLDYKIIRLHASDDGKSIYAKMGFTDSDGYMAMRLDATSINQRNGREGFPPRGFSAPFGKSTAPVSTFLEVALIEEEY